MTTPIPEIPKQSPKLEIPLDLVRELINQQFPQWTHLSISPVAKSGWDNKTFRLGQDMLIRLPSAPEYADKVTKEQNWLPKLAQHLAVPIPKPLALGKPSEEYPFNWSIYAWIEGENADTLPDHALPQFACDLAKFLNQLHMIDGQSIDTTQGPLPGLHNFWRGDHPSIYNHETQAALMLLRYFVDCDAADRVWQKAISSTWSQNPVWLHGDISVGNILVKNNRLTAVIDFGGTGIGDPACDLVIAWTFFDTKNREIFKSHIQLDSDTWARARGWALWKALITLVSLESKTSPEAIKQQHLIHIILAEHALENKTYFS
jgi:aminoglycoside phosphotransferase (APT) family kinase protein